MKQTLMLTAVATIFSSTLSAQIKKGAILLGGQIGYNNNTSRYSSGNNLADQKSKNAIFNISVGTAIKENKVLGLAVNYSHLSSDYNYNANTNSYYNLRGNQYGVDVFYRQYKKIAKDFYIFGELGGGYFGSKVTITDTALNSKTENTISSGRIYLSPGIAYRIYKKLQVELIVPQIAMVSYIDEKNIVVGTLDKYDRQSLNFNTSLNSSFLNNLSLGFKFVL